MYTTGSAFQKPPLCTNRRRPKPLSHTNSVFASTNVNARGAFRVAPMPSAVQFAGLMEGVPTV